jgi:hypothetical protein
MVPFTESFENILRDFEDAGIPVDAPGFYDHPAFAERFAQNPAYLNNYARFVMGRPYSPEYLAKAEKTLGIVCDLLHRELVEDGRLGACIDMALVLSRILDKLGIWNFPVLGALTTTYPAGSGIPQGFYWPVDHGAIDAGHAWIYAPPFTVIDITFGRQYYNPGLERYHPDAVYSKELSGLLEVPVNIEDICSSSILMEMDARGLPWNLDGLFATHPHFEPFFQVFPRTVVEHQGASHKFVPVAIGVTELPLEEMTDLQLRGKSGHEVFEEKIRPLFG